MKGKVLICLMVFILSAWKNGALAYNVFEENGKVGLKDEQGNVLIPASYEALGWSDGTFSIINNTTGYKYNDSWGIIGLDNHSITKAEFLSLTPTEGNLLIAHKRSSVSTHALAGCLNTSGKEVIPFQYEGLKVNSLRAVVFSKTGEKYKYGLVDLDNKPVIPLEYQHIKFLGGLRYAVEDFNNKQALYADDGKPLTGFIFEDISSFKKNYAVISQGHLQGVIDRNGLLRIQPSYKTIILDENGSAKGRRQDEWIILDGQNKTLQKVNADTLLSLNHNLYGLKKDNSFFLVNDQFKEVAKESFSTIRPFKGNKAIVTRDDRYGMINSTGNLVIDCKYEEVKSEKNYILARLKSNQWILLDSSGNRRTPKTYERIEPFNESLFRVQNRNYQGTINSDGREIISCVYDSMLQYYDDKLVVKFHNAYGVIDLKENWLVAPQPQRQYLIAPDRYLQKQGSTTFLKSFDGNIIYFTENPLAVKDDCLIESLTNGGTWKIDLEGRIISRQLPPADPYELICSESEGLRGIKKNGRYGFVDDQGRLRIANRYEDIKPFQETLSGVKILGKWGFINHQEKLVIQPVYEETSLFENGIAIVMQKDLYGLIDTQGKVVLPVRYASITRLPSKRFMIENEGLKGVADFDGRMIVAPKYDKVTDISNGYIIVERDGKHGLITAQGISTIPMIYDYLGYDEENSRYLAVKHAAWETIQ